MEFILLGFVGMFLLTCTAGTIKEYNERINGMDTTVLYHTHYTTARQTAYSNQELINLAEKVWALRTECIDNDRIMASTERTELFELLAQAASLVDTIRVRS